MPGSTFGYLFKITTWGETHGPAIGVVIDGCPAGMDLCEEDIQIDLNRRKPGTSETTSPRVEHDLVQILSGTFDGKTTGTPISLIIKNKDAKSNNYDNIKDLFRPGHADFTYHSKYHIRDYRGGGRSSGRETATRVAAGAIAKKILARDGIIVTGYTIQIGHIKSEKFNIQEIEKNPVRCPDHEAAQKMVDLIKKVKKEHDSIGGVVEVITHGVPPGLGEPIFDKLDGDLAKGLMSIGAVKGVEIGNGFSCANKKGSENNDELYFKNDKVLFKTNHSGGILGGISNGDSIIARIAVKPTASISIPQKSLNKNYEPAEVITTGRHDPCICPRVVPVAEAMMAIVIVDHLLRNKTIKY